MMPPRAPLPMPEQCFRAPIKRGPQPAPRLLRFAVFASALVGTGVLLSALGSWLNMGGMTWLEWALLALIGFSFVWVALSVTTVLAGLSALRQQHRTAPQGTLNTALLIPIYNEIPSDVFGNAAAMLDDLARQPSNHQFTLFILSDTRDPTITAAEAKAYHRLRMDAPGGINVHYRRRPQNTDRKLGNLADWITGWGAAYEAMLVLDADSLMAGRTITALADELATDPGAGLVQSFPMLIGAETVFARIQQFSNIAYGWLLAEGLAQWSRSEGNYWGHNAIIRTRAFAATAGLPKLGGDRLILSHDFVEAGLLRRAGWRVRFVPRLSGSFEETPATLIDYLGRDRRWCRGNLQHLRLLGARGLHPISRFHMASGAASYLLSPAWFLLLLAWSLLGIDADTNVIRYFNESSPLYPDWPQMTQINAALFLAIMYAVLLTPKLIGAGIIALHPKAHRLFGGRRAFCTAFATEITLSILFAPVLMVQQCRAVLSALTTRSDTWAPQNRHGTRYPLKTLIQTHWLETTLGVILATGLIAGLISPWLLPIVISLTAAIPLSALSGTRITQTPLRLDSPLTLREPAIVTRARRERARLRALLSGQIDTPAE